MTNRHRSVSTDHFAGNLQAQELALNTAILGAEIQRGFEQYLQVFEKFYADGLEVFSESLDQPIRGKALVRSALLDLLIPLHVMAEIGHLTVTIRATAIPGDTPDETHSVWTLELIGASGAKRTLSWSVQRKWKDSLVAGEFHYDHRQAGGSITLEDLPLAGLGPRA